MISLARYRLLLQTPGLRAALLASIVGRMPIGIAGLAILLYVQSRSGSFASAGLVSALYVLGLAVLAPPIGRLIDRLGPRPLLMASAVVYPSALLLLVMLVERGAATVWLAATALIGGALLPPITICMRALFPRLLADPDLLQAAYSLDSIVIETIFVAGPALIALFVAAGFPAGAVVFAAASAIVGSALFMRAPAIRHWQKPDVAHGGSLLGPLRDARLLALFAATWLYSIAFGLLEVAVTALATRQGAPAAGGIILALASFGSALGALVYGSRSWSPSPQRQYVFAQVAMALGQFALAPINDLVLMGVLCVAACSPMAPVIALQSMLVARLTPRAMLAESFTWAASCLLGGISAGIAAGGVMVEAWSPHGALLLAGAVTLAAALLSRFALVTADAG